MMEGNWSRFTPAEGGARLATAASERNILAVEYPAFISTRLVYEHAYKIRGSLFDGSQRSVHIARASRVEAIAYDYRTLTDLTIAHAVNYEDVYDWYAEMDKKEVLVCTSAVLKQVLEEGVIEMSNLNVLIIESCHLIYKDENLRYILKLYKESEEEKRPRILALTYPLFLSTKKDGDTTIDNQAPAAKDNEPEYESKDDSGTELCENTEKKSDLKTEKIERKDDEIQNTDDKTIDKDAINTENIDNGSKTIVVDYGVYENFDDFDMYEKLEWKIEELEKEVCCQMDLAEDIDGGKRLSATVAKPKELIIEYNTRPDTEQLPEAYVDLETFMKDTVNHVMEFLDDHRFDLIEIYGEDFIEELKNVPDPTLVPKDFLKQFLYVLDQLGPYAADKLAFSLLVKLEKLRVREKYDRHFLLLCLLTTAFVKIRCYTESILEKYTDWEKIRLFSTPKLIRFVEILEKFQPNDAKNDSTRNTKEGIDATKLLNDIENCDFMSLGNKIEDRMNVYEANLKDFDDCGSSVNNVRGKEISKNDVIGGKDSGNNCSGNEIRKIKVFTDDVKENNVNEIDVSGSQAKENDVSGSQAKENDVSGSQAKENDVSGSQAKENDVSGGQAKENDVSGSQAKENDVSGSQANENDVSGSQANKNDVSGSQANENDVSGSQSNENDVSGSQAKENDVRGSQSNENDVSGSQANENDVSGSQAKENDVSGSQAKENDVSGSQANENDVSGSQANENDVSGSQANENDVSGSQSNENDVSGSQANENDVSGSQSNENDVSGSQANENDVSGNVGEKVDDDKGSFWLPRKAGSRSRGRGRTPRTNAARLQQTQLNPDALCGIVFMKEALMAKTMFLVIVDMSRCNPKLSYLCAQYCAVDDTTETDCKQQGKRHETVLKKFRMHECNLLLATSALEEGIDLPRCNLVLRWDVPASYRSYGLCRGRARAARASATLLCCSGQLADTLLHNVATYRELDQIISRKCGCGIQDEPPPSEEDHADSLTCIIKPYSPHDCDNNVKNNTNVVRNQVNIDSVTIGFGNSNTNIEDLEITRNEVNLDNNAKVDDGDPKTNINDSKRVAMNVKMDIPNVNERKIEVKMDSLMKIVEKREGIDTNNIIGDVSISKDDVDAAKVKNFYNSDKTSALNDNEIVTAESLENYIDNKNIDKFESNIEYVNTKPDTESKDKDESQNVSEVANTESTENTNNDNKSINIDRLEINDLNTKGSDNIKKKDPKKATNKTKEEKIGSLNISDETNILNEDSRTTKFHHNVSHRKDCSNETDLSNSMSQFVNDNNLIEITKKSEDLINGVVKVCKDLLSDSDVGLNKVIGDLKSESARTNAKSDVRIVDSDIPFVDLSTAIPLINRYCAKLPSDTFTRLAPQWWTETVKLADYTGTLHTAYICTLRLPLNCPVKYNIVGHPMKTRVLARRMVALQACRILHKSGELDDQLMPIGKENFKAADLDCSNLNSESGDPNDAARPGTTKRRQYYYKRTAWAFTDCQPIIDTTDSEIEANPTKLPESPEDMANKQGIKRNLLYALESRLSCALPERYNTRGRRLHAPQHAAHAIGLLMAREHTDDLQIPAFPVYTRSGELLVSVRHVPQADTRVSPSRCRLVRRFMRFVFAEVLRVHRRGMKLQSDGSTHNNYYVVPTVKTTNEDGTTQIDVDWAFLELIYQHTEAKKHAEIEKPILFPDGETNEGKKEGVKTMENPHIKPGEVFVFDPEKYKEAVVTPWYRNQDQPQFFLVAEICWNLTPDSAFPSASHSSFRKYYSSKYGVTLTQASQPLLDVDHTSARLNLLTPRYVNRKGVALPVSSERTRRAKRDRLDQKQILLPELCTVHPFAAPLWFATVALPCVLYRINALLIADEIRRAVAIEVGLGIPKIDEKTCPGFSWPPLDFGWSLAEVLNADEKGEKRNDGETEKKEDSEAKEVGESDTKEQESTDNEGTDETAESKPKTVNDILQEKEHGESSFEIGTWSNEMAYNIPEQSEYDELMEPLPSNVTLVTSESGGVNWTEKPRQYNPPKAFSVADSDCSYMSSDFDTDTDSDESYDGDSGFGTGKINMTPSSFRIEYKTAHEAEAFDVERKKVNPAPTGDPIDDELDRREYEKCTREGIAPKEHIDRFRKSVAKHKSDIQNGHLIQKDRPIGELLPEPTRDKLKQNSNESRTKNELIKEMFPYKIDKLELLENGQVSLQSIERNKRTLLAELKNTMSIDEIKKMKCFSMVDVDIDSKGYVNEKLFNVGFDTKEMYEKKISSWDCVREFKPYFEEGKGKNGKDFDFDFQPVLEGHPGPSPSVILQALTMSNANDGINLERLETIGDSFLKFAITAYLYCAHPTVHEGKLSHMRSKQVSNLNLYRLGRNKRLGARMIASKFEPHDNWLPPCHKPPPTLHPKTNDDSEQNTSTSQIPHESTGCFIPYNLITQHSIPDKSIADCVEALIGAYLLECGPRGALLFMSWLGIRVLPAHELPLDDNHPYVRRRERDVQLCERIGPQVAYKKPPPQKQSTSRHSPQDTSDSDSVSEQTDTQQDSLPEDWSWSGRPVGSLRPYQDENGRWMQPIFGALKAPPSPLLRYIEDPEGELDQMLSGYDALERTLQYRFKDRSLLLQALTHASHHNNRLTDCYQRLEFLGDAILDYLITRHLYEEPRRHSPGALTDLRSALVNNTIFATLAARHGFHKYFRHMSPGLNEVLTKYVKIQEENGHSISEEHYLIQEDEMEQAEDVEVPKALGDLFESVAGAIFLDSGMSLGAVWKSYVNLMGAELEAFSAAAPKSPVRELLEAEPDTAKFGKPERLADGRRVRVSVEVFGRGTFKGIGRNYRIAKGTAARCALRHLRLLHKGR